MDPFYLGNPVEHRISSGSAHLCHDPDLSEPVLRGCYVHERCKRPSSIKDQNSQLLLSGQGVQAVRPSQEVPGETGSHDRETEDHFTKNQNRGLQIKPEEFIEQILLEVL